MKFIASISTVIASFALTVSAAGDQGRSWGYRTDANMVHTSKWAEYWPACGNARQSPIDIDTTTKSKKNKRIPLSFSGRCNRYNIAEPHEPLEVDVVGGETITNLRYITISSIVSIVINTNATGCVYR